MSPLRRRVTTAAVMSGTVSALWLAPTALSSYVDLSPWTALAALAPPAVAFGGLGIAHLAGALRMVDTRNGHRVKAEQRKAGLR